ncbi:MAG: ATP synthase F1 subunit gamma [Ruminococcaceae bacterium]|jgi:F-type H+-transporting ATPase subunit gamma|nr:ATP synthase F1 subunit gamma [Oscillospiraceae bacterium]
MREIRARIKSVKSTQQITKAMKMVSVAKLRRAQSGTGSMRLFAERCRAVMAQLPAEAVQEPLLTPRHPAENICYVLFVGNRGLCGPYNQAVLRFLQELLAAEERCAHVVVVGRWGRDVMEAEDLPVCETFAGFGDVPSMEDARQLAGWLKERYLSGAADEVHLVYQHYQSALQQTPVSLQLLPARAEQDGTGAEEGPYLFEPSAEEVLRSVVELYVGSAVFSALQDARVAEQAARMTAMTAATDATEELIGRLSLELNRARQAAITTEISEIVGGANALKNGEGHSSN